MNFIKFHAIIMFLIYCVGYISTLYAQTKSQFLYELYNPQRSPDLLYFDVSMINLASDFEGLSKLTINIKIVNDELQFIKAKNGGFQADYEVAVAIFDKNKTLADSMSWQERVFAKNFDETNAQNLFAFTGNSFDLEPGEYYFHVWVRDLETNRRGMREGKVTLRDFSSKNMIVSDLLFLNNRAKNQKTNIPQQGRLLAYFEVYNIPEGDSIQVLYQLLGLGGKILEESQYWKKSKGKIIKNYIQIFDKAFTNGFTGIRVKVQYKDQSSAMEGFLNTSSQRLLASFPDINDAIEKLIYIASDKEMKILRSATTKEEKIKEFLKFWQRHDPTPGTFENELMEEYYRRIEFANKHFFGNKEGWRTDMGMVYVKMGPPDYIDRPELMTRRNIYNVSDSYLRTYRVEWDYYEQGRRFIFYFKAGEFRLMNRDEVFDVLN